MATCTDCIHWNPDLKDQSYCENNTPDVKTWAKTVQTPVDCAQCPGFEEMPAPAPCTHLEGRIKAAGGQWSGISNLLTVWQEIACFPQLSDNGCPAAIDAIAEPVFSYRVRCGRLTLALGQGCLELAITLARASASGGLKPEACTIEPEQDADDQDPFNLCDTAMFQKILGQRGDQ